MRKFRSSCLNVETFHSKWGLIILFHVFAIQTNFLFIKWHTECRIVGAKIQCKELGLGIQFLGDFWFGFLVFGNLGFQNMETEYAVEY